MVEKILKYLTDLAVIGSMIFAGWQIRLYLQDYRLKNNRARIEKAIDLAKFYADDIYENMNFIGSVYYTLGVAEVIDAIDTRKMKNFDSHEMDTLFNNDDVTKINNKLKSHEMISILLFYKNFNSNDRTITKLNQILNAFDMLAEAASSTDENELLKKKIISNESLLREFDSIVTETLNNLECFSMYFNYGIADEKTVYQSLHQTFRSTIKLLYLKISQTNKDGKDKYYTNTIELFNKWNERYLENCDRK